MSDNMIVNAIREIAGMTRPQIYGVDGRQYASAELVEADGGAWKLEASRRILAWLEKELEAEIADGLVAVTL